MSYIEVKNKYLEKLNSNNINIKKLLCFMSTALDCLQDFKMDENNKQSLFITWGNENINHASSKEEIFSEYLKDYKKVLFLLYLVNKSNSAIAKDEFFELSEDTSRLIYEKSNLFKVNKRTNLESIVRYNAFEQLFLSDIEVQIALSGAIEVIAHAQKETINLNRKR